MNTNKEIFKQFIFRKIRGYEHSQAQIIFLAYMAFDYLESIEEDFYTEVEMKQAKDKAKEEYINRNRTKSFKVVDEHVMQLTIKNNTKAILFLNWLNSKSIEELKKYYYN